MKLYRNKLKVCLVIDAALAYARARLILEK